MNQDANQTQPSWSFDGKQYPLFPFDVPPVIKLPNGTVHHFRMWDEHTEKKREDLMKTVVITSPAQINGENPQDVRTDYTRSQLAYYGWMIEKIGGVQLNGNSPDELLNAQEEYTFPDGRKAKIYELVGAPIRKHAAARLYSGNVEIERPDADDEADSFEGDPFDESDITKAVEKEEERRNIYKLTLERNIVIRQELGAERLKSGVMTPFTHLMRYHLREPSDREFSKWELKGSRGYSVGMPKGGTRAEQFYNLETVKFLFDSLIERIEGASLDGREIVLAGERDDATRIALLKRVPLPIKKVVVARLFAEMNNLGNF